MPAPEFTFDSQNPVIRVQGHATFGPYLFCTWYTKNGSNSLLNIINPSSNTLYISISGAPNTIHTTTGVPLNGAHSIPPNDPTKNVQALGDFLGTKVTIANTTNPRIPAECAVTAVVQE